MLDHPGAIWVPTGGPEGPFWPQADPNWEKSFWTHQRGQIWSQLLPIVALHVMQILWCDHFAIKTNICREKLACKPQRCASQNCANSPQNVLKRESNSKLWIVVEILKRRKLPFKVVAGLCISTKAKAKAKKVSKEDFPVLILVLMFFLVHNCVYWRFSSVVTLSIFHFPSFHRCSQYVWHPLLNTHTLTTDMDIGGAEIFVGFAFSKAILEHRYGT